MQGLIGRKIGMTRIFNKEWGFVIPITIIHTGTNIVQQIKTVEKDGYRAVQLGFEVCSEKKVKKPNLGHMKKHNSEPTKITKEFDLDSSDEDIKSGQRIGVELFESVKYVDVIGTTKGRGFSGTVKKYGFHIGRKTHGNTNRRARGSLGAGTYPGRVFPGLKMAGQYGNRRVTKKGLEIIDIDKEAGLLYVKGCIPGRTKSIVFIRKNSVKL